MCAIPRLSRFHCNSFEIFLLWDRLLPATKQGSVEAVGFCATHAWVATGGTDGRLKVWDSVSGTCRHTCAHPAGVTKLEWHPAAPVGLLYYVGEKSKNIHIFRALSIDYMKYV